MDSSTSNFERPIPALNYRSLWVPTCVLSLLLFTASELYWRHHGLRPTVNDTMTYWSVVRDRVYAKHNETKIVVVGASRAQAGINPRTINAIPPSLDVIHLGIHGYPSLAVLRDLANDTAFSGHVIFCVTAEMLQPDKWDAAQPWVDFYHTHFGTVADIEKRLNAISWATLQSHLVIAAPRVGLKNIVTGRTPSQPSVFRIDIDRFGSATYLSQMTAAQRHANRQRRIFKRGERFRGFVPERLAEFHQTTTAVAQMCRQIRQRGGDVVLVRMPTTGQHWYYDEAEYPKKQFWDTLANHPDVRAIHFRDDPILRNFKCPDSSHIDVSDSDALTTRLCRIIDEHWGWWQAAGVPP